jgi:hypothetical protein
LNDNEELRKKIIDSYDSQLKDIFTEDEILAILDALKPQTLTTTSPGFWPTITTNAKGIIDANDIIHNYNNDMFKVHPEQDPLYTGVTITSTANNATNTVMEQCEN